MRPDYYAILELFPACSDEQIKAQYRKLARQYHPDVNPNDRMGATERLRQINEAYEVLSDPDKRRQYDAEIIGNAEGTPQRPSTTAQYTPPPSYLDPMRKRLRRREWSVVAILVVMLLRSLHPSQYVGVQPSHSAPDQMPSQPTSTSDRILSEGVPQSGSTTTAYSDLSALSAELQQIRPQIESIHSQGERACTLASGQPMDTSTPDGMRRQVMIDQLSSDLHDLENTYNTAFTALSQPAPPAVDDAQKEVLEVAGEIYSAKTDARNVARDVRALQPNTSPESP
jgi:curved DNA-binding protein CbpA